MSLRAPAVYVIPEETERAARASFPKGHPLMQLTDDLGMLHSNPQFTALFSPTGQPALDPARLALITVFQFMEGLTDAQAADAVRGHLAWKYALALPLLHPGFDSSVLSEFRARLIAGACETLLLDTLLEHARERGLLKARGRARTDSTHVLAATRSLSRLAHCGETLRAALNALAEAAPEWLLPQIDPAWEARYGRRVDEYRLPHSKTARAQYATQIGTDGRTVLTAVYAPAAPPALRWLPAVQMLRAVWVQQFLAPDAKGVVHWRETDNQPPGAGRILSPYDGDARFSLKRDCAGVGYKTHLTETCDVDRPHLITHVETTPASTSDEVMLEPIHAALQQAQLLPAEHLVDTGYVDLTRRQESRTKYQVQLVGPVQADSSWQAQAGAGYAATDFRVDWEGERVTCPAGQVSYYWRRAPNAQGQEEIAVAFRTQTCQGCAVQAGCTKSQHRGRKLTLLPREKHAELQAARAEQRTPEFKATYAVRSGVEGTISQGVRLGDLRQSRYRGRAKTQLQQIAVAVAVNVYRLVAWGQRRPRRETRIGRFTALARLAAREPIAA